MLKLREYTLQEIKDEVQALVTRGAVNYQNHLYDLVKFFGCQEWHGIEQLLENHDYRLCDNVVDLVGQACWVND